MVRAFFSELGHFFSSCAPAHDKVTTVLLLGVRTTLQWFCIFTLLWRKPIICLKWENIFAKYKESSSLTRRSSVIVYFTHTERGVRNRFWNGKWSPRKPFPEEITPPLQRIPYPPFMFSLHRGKWKTNDII